MKRAVVDALAERKKLTAERDALALRLREVEEANAQSLSATNALEEEQIKARRRIVELESTLEEAGKRVHEKGLQDGDPFATDAQGNEDLARTAKLAQEQVASLRQECVVLQQERGRLQKAREEALMRVHASESTMDGMRKEMEEMRGTERGQAMEAPPSAETPSFSVRDASGRMRRIGEVLVEAGILSEEQAHQVAEEQAANPQKKFGNLLVEMGFTNEDIVARVLAMQLALPFVDLKLETIDEEVPGLISRQLAEMHQCVPIREEGDVVVVAMINPLDLIAIEDVELATSKRVESVVSSAAQIRRVIKQYCP
jgi:chromosome segregation ATPase